MSGFFGRFVERERVARLETAQLSVFGFPCLKTTPLFDFIVAHEGIETNCGVWSLARKLKILGAVKIISISCDRRWPASAGFNKLLQTWSAYSGL